MKRQAQQPTARPNLTLDEALKFYGLTTGDLYVKAFDDKDQPVYAYRILPDRVVFVLHSGPKLMYPPQHSEHVAFVPKKNKPLALRMAGLVEDDDAEEED